MLVNKHLFGNVSATVILKDNRSITLCLASINWLLEHENKNYFGGPVQVWRKYLCNTCTSYEAFIPVSKIISRCAYIEKKVKFSQLLEEVVTVLVSINHYAGV